MDGLLSLRQRPQALERDVDMTDGGLEIEDGVEVDAPRDRRLGLDEAAEVALPPPGAHGGALDEPVRVVPREAGLDEREQQAVAEEQSVARVEVPAHALGIDDEALDDPGEAVE